MVSVAVALTVCEPSPVVVVFHEADQPSVLLVSTPREAPSAKNSTCVTPTLSVASAETVMLPETVDPGPGW